MKRRLVTDKTGSYLVEGERRYPLRKAGMNLKGECPVCHEPTSLQVSPTRSRYKCFHCGIGGYLRCEIKDFTDEKIKELWEELKKEHTDDQDFPKYLIPRKGQMYKNGIVFSARDREERDDISAIQQEVREFYSNRFGHEVVVSIQCNYMRRECPSAFIEY